MDDFVISNLQESRNEWCSRLISIFTPLVNEGVRSIFNEAWKLCVDNDEANKYLMTFQNLLARVPKWNNVNIRTWLDYLSWSCDKFTTSTSRS